VDRRDAAAKEATLTHSTQPKARTWRAQSKTQIWVLALTSVASLMIALDVLIVSTALDQIGLDFHAPVAALGWTVNAYTLTFAVLLMTAAVAGDRFGRRRMFVIGLLLFTAASAGCALATSVGWLIAARAIQGVGAAILMPMALAQVTAAYAPEQRRWALGIYSSVTALSSVLGPVVGGAITYGLAWQWIFWLNVPIGLVAAWLGFRRLPEAVGPAARADLLGLGLVTAGVLALVLGLVQGNDLGWANAPTIGLLAAGAACGVAFVRWEQRCAAPMVSMSLFKITSFAAGNAAMFLLNGAVMGAIFFMAQFQQVVLKQDALDAGLRLLPWGIALFLTAPRAAAVAGRFGESVTAMLGLALQGIGLAWLAFVAAPTVPYGAMVAPMIAAGVGFGLAIPIVQKSVVSSVTAAQIGKASGVLSMIRQLGGAFGVAIAVAAFAFVGSRADAADFSRGFAAAAAVTALLSFAGAIAALWLPRAARPA
jgi:EmrB/QacA subfamily drug resistance transporter